MENSFGFPILSLVVWFPTLGALFILFFMNKTQETQIKWAANIITFIGFVISLPLWFAFDNNGTQFQFREQYEWIPSIGVSYNLGMDGIGLLLVMMTTLLGFIAVLSSWNAITDRVKQYYAFLHWQSPRATLWSLIMETLARIRTRADQAREAQTVARSPRRKRLAHHPKKGW